MIRLCGSNDPTRGRDAGPADDVPAYGHQQGADAIAMLVDLARAPAPAFVVGLTLLSRLNTRQIQRPSNAIHSTRFAAPRYPSTSAQAIAEH